MGRWYTLVFLLGFFSCAFLFYIFSYSGAGIPFGTGLVSLNEVAPSDWVSENDIIVLNDRIILKIENATLSDYAATGSMKPLFDSGANGIRIVPKSEDDINVGDIVSFEFGEELVVHQVIEKGVDDGGVYFVTKGSNNPINDEKIRFENIKFVTIGVIW
jgi:hypothetical protein